MTRYPDLDRLRIGCVQYLNARPLIARYPGAVVLEHPSRLAVDIVEQRLDAALVPVFEALRRNEYLLVDDVAIASDGPVYSVVLAFQGELGGIRSIALDPASLTSVHLLQVLLAEFHGLRPLYVQAGAAADAQLYIGNQAIEFRESAPPGTRYLDLGEEWRRCTGLPFVYALWLLRPEVPEPERAAEAFRTLKREGLEYLESIIAEERDHPPDFARRYLTEHIRFDLREREKAGLQRFRELLHKHGFISEAESPLRFV